MAGTYQQRQFHGVDSRVPSIHRMGTLLVRVLRISVAKHRLRKAASHWRDGGAIDAARADLLSRFTEVGPDHPDHDCSSVDVRGRVPNAPHIAPDPRHGAGSALRRPN